MNDVHALSGAYAVDALDDIERARFEHHLADCAECQAEVDSLREAAALLVHAVPTAPPLALRERVLAEIANVRPLPPLVAPAVLVPRRRARRLLAVAAAVAILGGGATAVVQPWADDQSQGQLTAADRVLQAPDAEPFTTKYAGATATLTRSKSLKQAVLEADGIPAPPDGKTYELWLLRDGEYLPAGLIPRDEGSVLLDRTLDAADAEGAAVTVEEAGGSKTDAPSGTPIMAFSFEQA
ncbi:MAG: anti-sigma factor [Nocardioides sp.]